MGTVAGPVQLHSLFENMPLYGSATELAGVVCLSVLCGNTIVYLIIYCGSAACLQYVLQFCEKTSIYGSSCSSSSQSTHSYYQTNHQ